MKMNIDHIREEEESEKFKQHLKKRLVIKVDKGINFYANA